MICARRGRASGVGPRRGLAGGARKGSGRLLARPGCQIQAWGVWQETLAQLFNGLPAGSETETGASSPERQGAEASPFRPGHSGRALWTCSDAAAVPASSGQKAQRRRRRAAQSPFGSAGPPAAPPIHRQRRRVSSLLGPHRIGHSSRSRNLPPSRPAAELMVRCLQDFYLPWATRHRV